MPKFATVINDVREASTRTGGAMWWIEMADQIQDASTFDPSLGKLAMSFKGRPAIVETEVEGRFLNFISIEEDPDASANAAQNGIRQKGRSENYEKAPKTYRVELLVAAFAYGGQAGLNEAEIYEVYNRMREEIFSEDAFIDELKETFDAREV